jgi:SNF2 family DNA or RNA helicase
MLRRTKEEVLDLPAKVYSTEYVDMTPEQVTLYNRVIDGTVRDSDIPNNDSECILATLLKLRQISGGIGKYSNIVKNPKLDRLEQIVEEAVYSGTKVIVYSNWIQGITPAIERLAKYNPVVITGETKDADRQSIVNRFQNDDSVKVILGTIGALGTGLTLTAATEVVFIDEPWTNAAKEQACDRAHRIGTTSMVHIHTIIAHGTYDEDVHDIVLGKRDLATTIVEKRDLLKLKIA